RLRTIVRKRDLGAGRHGGADGAVREVFDPDGIAARDRAAEADHVFRWFWHRKRLEPVAWRAFERKCPDRIAVRRRSLNRHPADHESDILRAIDFVGDGGRVSTRARLPLPEQFAGARIISLCLAVRLAMEHEVACGGERARALADRIIRALLPDDLVG